MLTLWSPHPGYLQFLPQKKTCIWRKQSYRRLLRSALFICCRGQLEPPPKQLLAGDAPGDKTPRERHLKYKRHHSWVLA